MTFHAYGFIIGVAIVTALLICEFVLQLWVDALHTTISSEERENLKERLQQRYWIYVAVVLAGGVIGARLWHVLTDFHFYRYALFNIVRIRDGGLSIIGAFIGGFISFGTFWLLHTHVFKSSPLPHTLSRKKSFVFWLDLIALGLPIGQAIGRLGNWVNQELYGYPTSLPWALHIDQHHRLPGYEDISLYHPLFAYEIILLLPLIGILWFSWYRKKALLGSGYVIGGYTLWYSLVRFFLEFLRIDKTMVTISPLVTLGVNQLLMIIVFFSVLLMLIARKFSYLRKLIVGGAVVAFGIFGLLLVGNVLDISVEDSLLSDLNQKEIDTTIQKLNPTTLSQLPDGTKIPLFIEDTELEVEVVTSPQALSLGLGERTEIGSDGMLFVLAEPSSLYFWMHGMRFDLDIIWIRNSKIVGITKEVPAPGFDSQGRVKNSLFLPRYQSPGIVDMVLEVPSGFADSQSFLTGDTLGIK